MAPLTTTILVPTQLLTIKKYKKKANIRFRLLSTLVSPSQNCDVRSYLVFNYVVAFLDLFGLVL